VGILTERGDVDAAQRVVTAMSELETSIGHMANSRVSAALAAHLALSQGDHGSAAAWSRTIMIERQRDVYGDNPILSVLLKMLIAQNTPASLNRAQAVLTSALEYSQSVFDWRAYHEQLVWLASLRCEQHRHAEALDAMVDAVAFAQPRGIVRWFVEGAAAVSGMLAQLVRTGRRADEAAALLVAITPPVSPPSTSGVMPDVHVDLDSLTNRECELLELLAARLTNKEIASRLLISPNTVRNHTHSIYGKLHVSSRRQAVQQARARGLLR
jgi:LuxR family maltose regulon positive regulatory protein